MQIPQQLLEYWALQHLQRSALCEVLTKMEHTPPEESVFLLLGRELLSGGVPARPAGLSKMSSKGSELLPLAFQGCWKVLSLL